MNSVCNNVLLEHYRKPVSNETPIEEAEESSLPTQPADALDGLISKQLSQNVRGILELLPERDRRLLREIFLEERDKDDVCRDFGVDRDYLRVLLHRAKQSFKLLYLKEMSRGNPWAAGSAAE